MTQRSAPLATSFQILVTPDFNMAATMGFVDPFRAANYLDGTGLFRWQFVSDGGGAVTASNGAVLATEPLDPDTGGAGFVIVSSSWRPEAYVTDAIKTALRRADLRRATLGGIDTGGFVLGYAGLLAGYTATVHYEHIDAFEELFADTTTSEALWVFDRARITCCGGAAATEFALHIIRGLHGPALANRAARYVFAPPLRDHHAPQDPQGVEPLGATVPVTVRRAIKVMEEHLETPISITDLCAVVQTSHRQLNRLFAQYVGKTPVLYYRDIRLDRARGLVTQTSLPMSEIAHASGFSGQEHFSRAYKERFGLPPSRDRIDGRIPFEFRAWPMHRKSLRGEGE